MARKKKIEETVIEITPKLQDSVPEIVELDQIKSEDIKKIPEVESEEELHGQFNNVEPIRKPKKFDTPTNKDYRLLRPLRRL